MPVSTRRGRRYWPESVFVILLAISGLIFALGMPLCQGPDEEVHFYRAYDVSLLHLVPRRLVDGWGGARLPSQMVRIGQSFDSMRFHPEVKVNWNVMRELHRSALNPGKRQLVSYGASVNYSFVAFVPQALGIALARKLDLEPLAIFYAGRLANLSFSLLLVYLAIRISPVYKNALGAFALMPISVQQFASYSPDASAIGASFLTVAVCLRLAVGPNARAHFLSVASLFGLASWLTLTKFPYAAVTLLYAAIPGARIGSRQRQLLIGVGLAAIVLGLLVVATRSARRFSPDSQLLPGFILQKEYRTSVSGQLAFIRNHPIAFLAACNRTGVEHGITWFESLFQLGWLDTNINPVAVRLFLLFLIAVALLDQPPRAEIPPVLKAAALLAVCSGAGAILASLYVWWSPVGGEYIVGIQGRYFIPLLPLIPLLLNHRAIRIDANPRALFIITATGCAGFLGVSIATFIQRYYFSEPQWFLADRIIVSTAIVVTGLAGFLSQFLSPHALAVSSDVLVSEAAPRIEVKSEIRRAPMAAAPAGQRGPDRQSAASRRDPQPR
jgi:uncharacterized membrane protein